MGRRSGLPETEAEVARMTLGELNHEIERLLRSAYSGGGQGPKAHFKRRVWMERMREKLHGIPATRRLWRDR